MPKTGIADVDSYRPGHWATILQACEDAAARDFDLPAARGRDRALYIGAFVLLKCIQDHYVSVESDL